MRHTIRRSAEKNFAPKNAKNKNSNLNNVFLHKATKKRNKKKTKFSQIKRWMLRNMWL